MANEISFSHIHRAASNGGNAIAPLSDFLHTDAIQR